MIKRTSEWLGRPRSRNGEDAQNAEKCRVHIALNVALEIYLKGKLDAENGNAFVEAAARFNRWREVGRIRVGRV